MFDEMYEMYGHAPEEEWRKVLKKDIENSK
jgi:hypothetical protein